MKTLGPFWVACYKVGVIIILALVMLCAAEEYAKGQSATPPGWDWCGPSLSYYKLANETGQVYTSRWSKDTGYCAQGPNHVEMCYSLDDGMWYCMMDEYGLKAYPRPVASAGSFVTGMWDSCYVQHQDVFANPTAYPCHSITAVGGTQDNKPIPMSKLPEGGYKQSQMTLHHCTTPSPTPIPATPTPTPQSCTPREVTRLVVVTATPVPKTATPIKTATKSPSPVSTFTQRLTPTKAAVMKPVSFEATSAPFSRIRVWLDDKPIFPPDAVLPIADLEWHRIKVAIDQADYAMTKTVTVLSKP